MRMFHGKIVNREINHSHERSLRIVYKDYTSSFKDFTVHHSNNSDTITRF